MEPIVNLFIDYQTPEEAERGVLEILKRKERILGYGHWLLKEGDPLSVFFSKWNEEMAKKFPETRKVLEIKEKIKSSFLDIKWHIS